MAYYHVLLKSGEVILKLSVYKRLKRIEFHI